MEVENGRTDKIPQDSNINYTIIGNTVITFMTHEGEPRQVTATGYWEGVTSFADIFGLERLTSKYRDTSYRKESKRVA